MGKFLRDKDGNFVAIDGAMVLAKTLDRKPRDCEQCGFNKWVKKDKIFIIQRNGGIPTVDSSKNHRMMQPPQAPLGAPGGGMEWICPDCALRRGLPAEHYHKNFYATPSPEAIKLLQSHQEHQRKTGGGGCETSGWNNILDLTGFMCNSG